MRRPMTKRIVAIVAALAMTLAACGDDDGAEVRDLGGDGSSTGSGSGTGSGTGSGSGSGSEMTSTTTSG